MKLEFSSKNSLRAKRINGILKGEFGIDGQFSSFNQAKRMVEIAIEKYNTLRPHFSCDLNTPQYQHAFGGKDVKTFSSKIRNMSAI